MQKIILYYKFTPVTDPEAVRLWQKSLCEKLNLKGRIIIAAHGINGTLGGDLKSLKAYIKETKSFKSFKGTEFKWSDGSKDHFPRLSVKVRPEIVSFGVPSEIKVDEQGIKGSGKHLKPKQVHELVKARGKDVIFFDGRNAYEAEIGRFKGAVVPNVKHTRDFPSELDKTRYEELKDKPVITYCTGGIRCEVLSMLMIKKGFKEVYQIEGGIAKYGKEYPKDSLWDGSLYVFDGRMDTKFSEETKDIGKCEVCNSLTSNFENCGDKSCNRLILLCEGCKLKGTRFCTDHKQLAQV